MTDTGVKAEAIANGEPKQVPTVESDVVPPADNKIGSKEGVASEAQEEAQAAVESVGDVKEAEGPKDVVEDKAVAEDNAAGEAGEAGAGQAGDEAEPVKEVGGAEEAPKETGGEAEVGGVKGDTTEVVSEQATEASNPKKTKQKKEKAVISPRVSTRPQRERKSAERFAVEDSRDKATDIEIKQGKGVALKEIPNIVAKLGKKTRSDEILVMLHSLLYTKRAKAHVVKKNILEFSGFVWADNEAKERAKVKDKLSRYTKEGLSQLLDILDLPTGGKKDESIARVLEFLEEPHESEEDSKKRKTPAKTPSKDAKAAAKSGGKGKEEEEDEEVEDEGEEAPASKKQKVTAKSPVSSPAGKRKAPATEANLRKKIKEILKDADLNVMTTKKVTETLAETVSGDLEKKKDIIKKLIKEVLSPGEESFQLAADTTAEEPAGAVAEGADEETAAPMEVEGETAAEPAKADEVAEPKDAPAAAEEGPTDIVEDKVAEEKAPLEAAKETPEVAAAVPEEEKAKEDVLKPAEGLADAQEEKKVDAEVEGTAAAAKAEETAA